MIPIALNRPLLDDPTPSGSSARRSGASTCSCRAAPGTGTGRCSRATSSSASAASSRSSRRSRSSPSGRCSMTYLQREDEPAGRDRRRLPHAGHPHRAEDGAGEGQVRRHRAGDLHRRGPGERSTRSTPPSRCGAPRRGGGRTSRSARRCTPMAKGPLTHDRHDRVPRRRLRLRALRPVLATASPTRTGSGSRRST